MWPWPKFPLELLGADDHWHLSGPVCPLPDRDALDQVEHMWRRGWKESMKGPVKVFLQALQYHNVNAVICDRCKTNVHHLSLDTCLGPAHLDRIWEQREQLQRRGVGYAQGRKEFWQWVQLRVGAELGLNHLDGAIAARRSSGGSSSCGLRQSTGPSPYSGHAPAAHVDAKDHLAVLHQQPAAVAGASAWASSVTRVTVALEEDVRVFVNDISQNMLDEFRRKQMSLELCVDVCRAEMRRSQPPILRHAAGSSLDQCALLAARGGPRRGWFPNCCVKKETRVIRIAEAFNGGDYGHDYLSLEAGDKVCPLEHRDADDSWAFGVQVLQGAGSENVQGWYPKAFGVPDTEGALEVVYAFDGGMHGQEYLVLAPGVRIMPVHHRGADEHWSYGELLGSSSRLDDRLRAAKVTVSGG